jgi:hypothetical protein
MVRHRLGIVLLTAALAGCGSSGGEERARAPSGGDFAAGRSKSRCALTVCSAVLRSGSRTRQKRAGTPRTPTVRGSQGNGWVYDDGVLTIAAYDRLLRSGTGAGLAARGSRREHSRARKPSPVRALRSSIAASSITSEGAKSGTTSRNGGGSVTFAATTERLPRRGCAVSAAVSPRAVLTRPEQHGSIGQTAPAWAQWPECHTYGLYRQAAPRTLVARARALRGAAAHKA